jgi:hypothetical protein
MDATVRGGTHYVFGKYDGSSLRSEWDPKKGFWKHGKRNGLIDHSNPHLLRGPGLFKAKYEADLSRIFREARWRKAVVFYELWGPRSFAGQHEEGDDLTVTVFDVAGDNRGILPPGEFLRLLRGVDHAALLHHGAVGDIIEQVRDGTLPGMPFEGVVCKSAELASPGLPRMFKLKNQAWYARLRERCQNDEALFNRLA